MHAADPPFATNPKRSRRAANALMFLAVACGSFGATTAQGQSRTAAPACMLSAREYAVSKAWLQNPVLPARARPPVDQKRIKLFVDNGAAGGGVQVLGTGIPLREGQVRSLEELGIEGSKQGPVPAALTQRTAWPDGSLQWAWADFQGRADAVRADSASMSSRTSTSGTTGCRAGLSGVRPRRDAGDYAAGHRPGSAEEGTIGCNRGACFSWNGEERL